MIPLKVYAAYDAAVKHKGQPTLILAKTVKGYGMGDAGEGQNITHQQKKMGENNLREFRDRFQLPISDEQLAEVPFLRFDEGSPEMEYLRKRREALGGSLQVRRAKSESLAGAAALGLRGAAEEHRRARNLDHDGLRAHPQHALARQADRQARGADRAGRVAAPSAWRACSASSASSARSASSTGPRTPTS